ncbi:MAG TPA: UvrD-helicase domain-containing protein [Polyangiaceae bacterium]
MSVPGLARNAVIAASAGTGKTQTLTSIYLCFALGLEDTGRPLSCERIAATTFSRAAAAEIRERLELRLRSLSSDESRDPLRALAESHGLSQRDLKERVAVTLRALPSATIDTLHGLALRLLRRHALELGLSESFVVLDEDQALTDAERVIDDTLSDALTGPKAAATARLIDACRGLEGTRWSLYSLLDRLDNEGLRAEELAIDSYERDAEAELARLRAICEAIARAEPCALSAAARGALAALAGRDFVALRAALSEFALVTASKKLKEAAFWPEFSAFQDGLGSDAKPLRFKRFVDFQEQAGELAAELRDVASLLAELQQNLLSARRRAGLVSFGDALRLARDGLRDHPEIALRARAEFDVVLVDEFQDTSRVQRDLLFLLRERPESIRGRRPGCLPNAGDLSERGLIVVGDRKQSIYAFRGADVSVFTELAVELSGPDASSQLDLQGVPSNPNPVASFHTLTENYRSQPALIEAINVIARRDFSERPTRPFEIRYTDAEALVAPSQRVPAARGRVTLLEDDAGTPPDAAPIVTHAKPAQRSAFVAAGLCARLAEAGTPLREIAILARRRATLPLVEIALDHFALPFVVAGRALYRTAEVRDLSAALRLLREPRDRHALAIVARGPLAGLSDQTLAALSQARMGLADWRTWGEVELRDAEERAKTDALLARLQVLFAAGPKLSPRQALALIVELFELEAVYAALPRGRERFGNVERLLEIASRHGGNLNPFVRWLGRQIALDVDEAEAAVFSEEDDAVRLLTVHGSKGLAFPTVIMLDVGGTERPRTEPLSLLRAAQTTSLVIRHRTDQGALSTPLQRRAYEDATARARAERQRLSYVALTRAREHLAIVLPPGKPTNHSLANSIAGELWQLAEIPGIERVSAASLLTTASRVPRKEPGPTLPVPERPAIPRVARVSVGVTALSDFAICARRFRLTRLLGIAEPALGHTTALDHSDDPRSLGSAAHRVLERFPESRWGEAVPLAEVHALLVREGLEPDAESTHETANGIARFLSGRYARELRARGATLLREMALSVPLSASAGASAPAKNERSGSRQLDLFAPRAPVVAIDSAGMTLVLKATLDLVVRYPDHSIDVVDYKRSRGGDDERYAFQLAAYRDAARAHFGTSQLRVGLVHLLGDAEEPSWQQAPSFDLTALGSRLAAAQSSDVWPAIAEPNCRAARCGFVLACHAKL